MGGEKFIIKNRQKIKDRWADMGVEGEYIDIEIHEKEGVKVGKVIAKYNIPINETDKIHEFIMVARPRDHTYKQRTRVGTLFYNDMGFEYVMNKLYEAIKIQDFVDHDN